MAGHFPPNGDGTNGDDLIVAPDDGGSHTIHGFDGNDDLRGNGSTDYIYGGNGDDRIIGNGGSGDHLYGQAGNDHIYGDGYLYAGTGDDTILVGDFADYINGEEDNDHVWAGGGDDVARGGSGDDVLYGELGSDRLIGDDGNDVLFGGEGDDNLKGLAGNDTLIGGAGADYVFGGDGDDRLQGGPGRDVLEGDAGADRFVYDDGDAQWTRSDLASYDFIRFFFQSDHDLIDLSPTDADTTVAGDQAFTFWGTTAPGPGHPGALWIDHVPDSFWGESTVVFADTDGDGGADIAIRMPEHVDLTAQDFVL